jgi:RND family efflux transporter MFP subunit
MDRYSIEAGTARGRAVPGTTADSSLLLFFCLRPFAPWRWALRRSSASSRLCICVLGASLAWGPPAAAAEEVEAVLQWARRVELSTPVSGTVTEVLVQQGEIVQKGQPLLRLDPRPFEARVEQAQAELDRIAPAREEAERERERAEELYDRAVLANHELDLARVAHERADAEHLAARAVLAQARLELEHSTVRAPFDAVVVRRDAELGQTVVTRLQPVTLVVVAEAGRMVARAALDHDRLEALAVGQAVAVTVAGRRYEGTLARIALEPVAGPGEPRYELDVQFTFDPALRLRAGRPATLSPP